MIYLPNIWIYLTFFLFTWYSAKLLKDVSGVDQYWHIPQMIFLIAIYLLPYFFTRKPKDLMTCLFAGLQFPFIFNSGLNLYRGLPISHLGKYDFLNFETTIGLFAVGVILSILNVVFAEKVYGER